MNKSLLILCFFGIAVFSYGQVDWNAPMNIAASSSGNNHPRIATDAAGNPLVVWYHTSRVMLARWNGTSFNAPEIINPVTMPAAGASWMGPDIAAHGDTVYIVFKQTPEHDGRSWIMRSFDGGETFSDPVQLDFDQDSLSRFPTVTTDETGNPIVAFMKFNSTFGDARWVVTRSFDFGETFTPDVLASGWSSSSSQVCDCCPGSIVSSGNTVAMLYRDNKNNIRDTWAGFSYDGGVSFSEGANIDQHNWNIAACPASGPDGVILGDTLYSTFLSSASGKSLVYFNRTSLTNLDPQQAQPVTGDFAGLGLQNFPRISGHGKALAVVWKQLVNNKDQLVMNFTNDVENKSLVYDTIDLENILNADVTLWNGNVFVVWEDNAAGTVKFRMGTYEFATSIDDEMNEESILVFPNPSDDGWHVQAEELSGRVKIEVTDMLGRVVGQYEWEDLPEDILIENGDLREGIYLMLISYGGGQSVTKIIKN